MRRSPSASSSGSHWSPSGQAPGHGPTPTSVTGTPYAAAEDAQDATEPGSGAYRSPCDAPLGPDRAARLGARLDGSQLPVDPVRHRPDRVSLAIIFIECGLLFPILPGDSLLFAIGLFIATDKLPISLWLALILLFVAAFLGNVVGYEIGRAVGPAIYRHDGRIIKRKYWDQTHEFFEKHGSKALVIGRFVPIVRTFVTVVAGIGRMDRRKFLMWSAVGRRSGSSR